MNENGGFLNDEYEAKVAELDDRYQPNEGAAERLYLDQCREIQRVMKDGTPMRVVRRIAFQKTESALADADDYTK